MYDRLPLLREFCRAVKRLGSRPESEASSAQYVVRALQKRKFCSNRKQKHAMAVPLQRFGYEKAH